MEQLITPSPNIACTPGWCKVYVEATFTIPASGNYPTAISNWNGSQTKHQDQNWPGLWFPIWFTVNGNADGHVALHAPDHSIYSSSSPTSHTPVHHSSLAAMQQYWNKGLLLNYLGWTEDIEYIKVIGDNMAIIEDADNWRGRAQASFQAIRGRDMGAGEFEPFIGQDFLHLIEALEDDSEASQWHQYGVDGRAADAANWPTQVSDLQTQLTDEQAKTAEKDTTITNLNAQIEALKGNSLVSPPVVVPVVHATPTQTPSNWTWLLNLLKGFFK